MLLFLYGKFSRKRLIFAIIVLLVIVATILDLYYLAYRSDHNPKITKVEMDLNPLSADASINIQGNLSTSGRVTYFKLQDSDCEYFYRKDINSSYSLGTEISVLIKEFNIADQMFKVDIQLQNSHYDILRRTFWDLSSNLPVESESKISCNIRLNVVLWNVASFDYTFVISQTLKLDQYKLLPQQEPQQQQKNTEDNLQPPSSNSSQPISPIEIQPTNTNTTITTHGDYSKSQFTHINTHSVRYKFVLNVNNYVNLGTSLKSFVIHLPKIAYYTTFVDKGSKEKKSYLKLRTHATSFDLLSKEPVVIELKASCTPAVDTVNEVHTTRGSCTLLSPLNMAAFKNELMQHSFVNITSYSNTKNFLTSFAGRNHYIRSVTSSNRQLTIGHEDPQISTGANCMIVDSDGVYMSNYCSVVEEGFFKLFVQVYSDEGYTGYFNSVTSWAPLTKELAFDSQLEGMLEVSGRDYKIFGHTMFSETFQNLTCILGLNYSSTDSQLFLEALTSQWQFDGASTGEVVVESFTMLEGYPNVKAYGDFEYGNHTYMLNVLAADQSEQVLGEYLTVFGTGHYEALGDKLLLSLTNSTLLYDQTVLGHATAAAVSIIPLGGVNGTLGVTFDVVDGSYQLITASNFTYLGWETVDSWDNDGLIYALSCYDLVDDENHEMILSWNATSYFQYSNQMFSVFAIENPLPAGSMYYLHYPHNNLPLLLDAAAMMRHEVRAGVIQGANMNPSHDQFKLFGYGEYDGDWSQWVATLADSIVIMDRTVTGYAMGNISWNVPGSGINGEVEFASRVLNGSHAAVFDNYGVALWTTASSWSQAGCLSARSMVNVFDVEGLNWNATGHLGYSNHSYSLLITENDYNLMNNELIVLGEGKYGGDWTSWWVTLNQSDLVFENALVGKASGGVTVTVPVSGIDGDLYSYCTVTDKSDAVYATGTQSLQWDTQSSWLNNGQIVAKSTFFFRDLVNWNATGNFHYGNARYSIAVTENDYDIVNNELSLWGYGSYGGDWSDWWASLDQSQLVFANNLIGKAVGKIVYNGISDGSNGTIRYYSIVQDSTGNPVIHSNQSLQWASPAMNWNDAGKVSLDSQWSLQPNILCWNATGEFFYQHNHYSFSVNETGSHDSVLDQINAFGFGTYNGSWKAWEGTLDEAMLFYNNDLIGSTQAVVAGISASDDWNHDGMVTFHTNTKDSNYSTVLITNMETKWLTHSLWTEDGLFSIQSLFDGKHLIAWNASSVFAYEQNAYSFIVQEQDVIPSESYLMVASPQSNHLQAMAQGGFDLVNWHQWWVSVTDSLLQVDDIVYANVRAYLNTNTTTSGTIGLLVCNVVDYKDSSEPAYDIYTIYPNMNSFLWTQNTLHWKYNDGKQAEGNIYTNTTWFQAPQFELDSLLNVDLVQQKAVFEVNERLLGLEGLNAWAKTSYDESTGMIQTIEGEARYANVLMFGTNTSYDLQLQSIYNPNHTITPTMSPTLYPTILPSMTPTCTPSTIPSIVPTITTELPTILPTLLPTAIPFSSLQPSQYYPTAISDTPTIMPTTIPTIMPSMSVTPSVSPSLAPSTSMELSFTPTTLPSTISPSIIPSYKPVTTFRPSQIPTYYAPLPTVLTWKLSFQSNLTFSSGISTVTLQPSDIEAILNTTAISMQVSVVYLNYSNAFFVSPTITNSSMVVQMQHLRSYQKKDMMQTTTPVMVVIESNIIFTSLDHINPMTYYDVLTTNLQHAVQSGFYTVTLQTIATANHANNVLSANVTSVQESAYTLVTVTTPTIAPTMLPIPSSSSSSSAITLVINVDSASFYIGVIFVGIYFLLFFILSYFVIAWRSNYKTMIVYQSSRSAVAFDFSLKCAMICSSLYSLFLTYYDKTQYNFTLAIISKLIIVANWIFIVFQLWSSLFWQRFKQNEDKVDNNSISSSTRRRDDEDDEESIEQISTRSADNHNAPLSSLLYIECFASKQGRNMFSFIALLSMFEATFIRLLPWKKTTLAESLDGYPNLLICRSCLYSSIFSQLLQLIISFMHVAAAANDNTSLLFNILVSLLLCIIALFNFARNLVLIMFQEISHSGEMHNSILFDNNKTIIEEEAKNANISIDERGIRFSITACEDDNDAMYMKVDEDTPYSTADRYADETINMLKSQIIAAGLQPMLYIPLNELQTEINSIIDAINHGHYEDSEKLDSLLKVLEIHPDYLMKQAEELKLWQEEMIEYSKECFILQQAYIPPHIFHATLQSLTETDGMKLNIAKRILNKKCLWLLRVTSDDIARIHIAELKGRFNYEGQGLDIVEMTALYSILPTIFHGDTNGSKYKWKKGLETQLRIMHTKKEQKQLLKNQLRNNVYMSQEGLYGQHDSTFQYLDSIKSPSDNKEPTSRISFLLRSGKRTHSSSSSSQNEKEHDVVTEGSNSVSRLIARAEEQQKQRIKKPTKRSSSFAKPINNTHVDGDEEIGDVRMSYEQMYPTAAESSNNSSSTQEQVQMMDNPLRIHRRKPSTGVNESVASSSLDNNKEGFVQKQQLIMQQMLKNRNNFPTKQSQSNVE